MSVWRVGHYGAPCDFPPKHLYAWSNRFDDPNREYRTIYCADDKRTCLREVLADFHPDTKALLEYRKLFGSGGEEEQSVGRVPMEWRRRKAMAEAEIKISSGTVVDVEAASIRKSLENRLADLLMKEGIRHLNMGELRSKKRHVTKRISRTLFDDGHAGIKFHSHLDGLPCHALFEFRAQLNQLGKAVSLAEDISEFILVCKEFSLAY